jgi:hypothetical protein
VFRARSSLSKRPNTSVGFVADGYRNIEDVPAARDGSDCALRIAPESTPDLNQALHKRIVSYKGVLPDCADDLFLTQEAPVIFSQEPEHFEGLWPKP